MKEESKNSYPFRDSFDAKNLFERTVSSERFVEPEFLTLEKLKVELPNGHIVGREVVRHPGAVAVFALDTQDRVLLVAQYRIALDRVLIEIPAGKLEPGEDSLEAAKRELVEETGVKVDTLEPMLSIVTAAGFSNEVISIYRAKGLSEGTPHPDRSWYPS